MKEITKKELFELSKESLDDLFDLAEVRGSKGDKVYTRHLLLQGVIYSKSRKELESRLNGIGHSLEELGLTSKYTVEDGWLIPVYSSKDTLLYWINYSNTRDSNLKYLNATRKGFKDKMVYGLDQLDLALEDDYLVWVEGVIDQQRLASVGVPAVATLGTNVTPYMEKLSRRVSKNIIIPDNDWGDDGKSIGLRFGKYLRSRLSNAIIQELSYVKDVDDCYTDTPEQFNWLINNFKENKRQISLEVEKGDSNEL